MCTHLAVPEVTEHILATCNEEELGIKHDLVENTSDMLPTTYDELEVMAEAGVSIPYAMVHESAWGTGFVSL